MLWQLRSSVAALPLAPLPSLKHRNLEKFGYTISCARDALKSPLSFVTQKTRCPDGLRSRNHQELGASV